jgi:hypothetical protein
MHVTLYLALNLIGYGESGHAFPHGTLYLRPFLGYYSSNARSHPCTNINYATSVVDTSETLASRPGVKCHRRTTQNTTCQCSQRSKLGLGQSAFRVVSPRGVNRPTITLNAFKVHQRR